MRPNPSLTLNEITVLKEAEDMRNLADSAGFQKIRILLKSAVEGALKAADDNPNPHLDSFYLNIWRERKFIADAIETYIDGIANQRREVIKELFTELGFAQEQIEKNMDMDLDFLLDPEARNGNQ